MEVDLSNLDMATRGKVDEIFRRDFDLQVLKAIERQKMVAARNHLSRPVAKDGFGGKTIEVDAFIDAIWRNVYGWNYSHDPDLVKFLSKRNPEIRVRSQGTRVQVGYGTGSQCRFRKSYPVRSAERGVGNAVSG